LELLCWSDIPKVYFQYPGEYLHGLFIYLISAHQHQYRAQVWLTYYSAKFGTLRWSLNFFPRCHVRSHTNRLSPSDTQQPDPCAQISTFCRHILFSKPLMLSESPSCKKKRIGRGQGSGHGGTAGRGHNGQKSRSGNGKPKAGFEGGQTPITKRFPKRGFVNQCVYNHIA
jgi:hypothetical protein